MSWKITTAPISSRLCEAIQSILEIETLGEMVS